jgi:ATP-binding cassette subfamily F protein 3
MDEIQAMRPKWLPAEIRDYLARFLFTGDDVFKEVNLLSGGERGRLALACLALQGANLMLLDEPTNHLDLPSQEILQAILAQFQGTILLVSHDRYLIDALASQVWEVLPGERKLNIFKGTYSEYRAARQAAADSTAAPAPVNKVGLTRQPSNRRGLSKGEHQKLLNRIHKLENEIASLEEQSRLIETQLSDPRVAAEKILKLGAEYARVQSDLEERIHKWSELSGTAHND